MVGRVGDALRVADDPGIENDFPPDFSGRAETYALVDGAVREDQNAFSDGACLRFILAQYSTSLGRDSTPRIDSRDMLPKECLLNHIKCYPNPIKDRVTCTGWLCDRENSI